MNQAHFHLLVNHLPIIFPIVGVVVLLSGFVFRSEILKRMASGIFIIGSICTIPAFVSGEGAEETIEKIQGFSEQLAHKHEEAAEIFALLSYILGGLSVITLWANWQKKSFSNLLAIVLTVYSGIVLFFAAQTGLTGGEIRHTEIRNPNAGTIMNEKTKEHDD